ncbi:MAG: hypothetical protein HY695_11715 [Deltaproteobacteria bacterium]|nr:hypothetical protein [Deltaproteobacteria bacterium]
MAPETSSAAGFDPLVRFAGIERLVGKIYFRFSHLFFDIPELRDFWWQMAVEEEQHACILLAIKTVIESYPGHEIDPGISQDKAAALEERLLTYLSKGTPSIAKEEAFRIAVEIESSEIDAIYNKLVHIGGPKLAKIMERFAVPCSAQLKKLRAAIKQFTQETELLARVESL